MAIAEKRSRRPTQLAVPGTESMPDPQIRRLAFAFIDAKDAKKKASEDYEAAGESLLVAMEQKGLKVYVQDGLQITIDVKRKAKVEIEGEEKDEEEPAA